MIRFIVYLIGWALSKVYLLLYHRCRVYNQHRARTARGKGVLVASNHTSYIDPLIVGTSFHHKLWYLARSTLFERSKLFTWLISNVNAVPISRKRLDISTMRLVKNLCSSGQWVLIFPEGTRSENGELQRGLAGIGLFADKIDGDIIPVYHEGSYEGWSRHMKLPRPKKIYVNIGKPFDASRWNELPQGKERYQQIADEIMIEITKLRDELQEIIKKPTQDSENK